MTMERKLACQRCDSGAGLRAATSAAGCSPGSSRPSASAAAARSPHRNLAQRAGVLWMHG